MYQIIITVHIPEAEICIAHQPYLRQLDDCIRGAVVIEDNVWIGDNVNIVGPVRIGFGAVIAANSVVRKDVPPLTIVAGGSAHVIKKYNQSTKKWENKS